MKNGQILKIEQKLKIGQKLKIENWKLDKYVLKIQQIEKKKTGKIGQNWQMAREEKYRSVEARSMLALKKIMKKFVKLCLHSSYIVQNSFHFDEIFHKKNHEKILVKVCLRSSYTLQNTMMRKPIWTL